MAKENLKVIEISRKLWGRGKTGGTLRDPDTGLQCCLGFVCRAFGCKVAEIEGHGMPAYVDPRDPLPSWLLDHTLESDVNAVANINDSREILARQRESQIKTIFARNGLKAVFVP